MSGPGHGPAPDPAAVQAAVHEWLTVSELADLLRMPRQTVYVWRLKGFGPPGVKIGTRLLYRRTAVESWLREQERLQNAGRGAA